MQQAWALLYSFLDTACGSLMFINQCFRKNKQNPHFKNQYYVSLRNLLFMKFLQCSKRVLRLAF